MTTPPKPAVTRGQLIPAIINGEPGKVAFFSEEAAMAHGFTLKQPAVTLESIIKRVAHSYANGPNCEWYDERKGQACGEPPEGKHHIRYGSHREISWMHEFEPEQIHDPNCACKALESYAAEQREFREGLEKLRDECDRLAKADGTWAIRTRWAYEQMTEKLTALLGKE